MVLAIIVHNQNQVADIDCATSIDIADGIIGSKMSLYFGDIQLVNNTIMIGIIRAVIRIAKNSTIGTNNSKRVIETKTAASGELCRIRAVIETVSIGCSFFECLFSQYS